jgi:DNA-binding NtrC family response regulator
MNGVIKIMQSLGIVVDLASSTTSAMESLERRRYDVLISDMARDADQTAGITLTNEARQRGHTLPILLTVGRHEPERGGTALRLWHHQPGR